MLTKNQKGLIAGGISWARGELASARRDIERAEERLKEIEDMIEKSRETKSKGAN